MGRGCHGILPGGRRVEGGPAEDEKGVINGGAGDTAMGTQGRACGGEGSVVKVAEAQGDRTALGGTCEEER